MAVGRRVVITGVGVVCRMGDSPGLLLEGLCLGRPAAGPVLSNHLDPHLAGRNTYPLDRPARLLAAAASLALADCGMTAEWLALQDVGLFVGTMFSTAHTISRFDRQAAAEGPASASPLDFANTVINAPPGQTAIWHVLRGINRTVATGASSGLEAVGCAAEAIRTGRADWVLAGGVEELSAESVHGFRGAGLLCGEGDFPRPFDPSTAGTALSEGAALLVLETAQSAEERGARVLAEVAGHGRAFDATRRRDDRRSVLSVVRSMRQALEQAGYAPEHVDVLCASACGVGRVDRFEETAITAVFEADAVRPMVSVPKAVMGEPLGAAGPLQCAAMIEALRLGSVPAVLALPAVQGHDRYRVRPQPLAAEPRRDRVRTSLINSLSMDGHSCSLVLSTPSPV